MALIYILLAICISAGRFYMPQLEKLAPDFIEVLERQTGLDWKLEGVSGEWQRFRPVFRVESLIARVPVADVADKVDAQVAGLESDQDSMVNAETEDTPSSESPATQLSNVQISEPQNKTSDTAPVFELLGGELQVDIIGSLIDREPRILTVQAKRLHLSFDKNDSDSWSLRGLVLKGGDRKISLEGFIKRLQTIVADEIYIDLPNNDLSILQERVTLPKMAMQFRRFGELRRFEFTQQDDAIGSFKFLANSRGNVFSKSADIDIYLNANHFSLSPWVKSLSTDGAIKHWQVDDLTGQLWFARASGQRWRGTVQMVDGSIQRSDSPQWRLSDTSLQLGVEVNDHDGIDLWWQQLDASWNDEALNMPLAKLSIARQEKQISSISLMAPYIDIGQLKEIIVGSELITGRLPTILNTLNPDGIAGQLLITIPNGQQMADFALQANLQGVSFDPWQAVPGATGVAGYVDISASSGVLELDSDSDFSVYFPKVYKQPLEFSQVQAQIDWAIAHERVMVNGRDLLLSPAANNEGKAHGPNSYYGGGFSVNAKIKPDGEPSQMSLDVGVSEMSAPDLLQFLPYTVDSGLQDWIAQADIQGHVFDGGFIYNGSLKSDEGDKRSIQLYFNLADASLNFQPDWPQITAVDGLLAVSGSRTDMSVYAAKFEGLSLQQTDVAVHTAGDNRSVKVDANLTGDLGKVLSILQNSPLKKQFSLLDGWKAKGPVSGARLQLEVPFNAGADTQVDFVGRVDKASLSMTNIDLTVKDLVGPIAYSSKLGLVSKNLQGSLWGKSISLTLGDFSADPEKQSGSNFRVDGKATADIKSFYHWLKQPVLAVASGQTEFNFRIDHINANTHLSASSDLQGVGLQLPGALYKSSSSKAALNLNWRMSAVNQPMQMTIADRAAIDLNFNQFALSGGSVYIDSELARLNSSAIDAVFAQTDTSALNVSGHLKQFNLNEWLKVFDKYLLAESDLNVASSQSSSGNLSENPDGNLDDKQTSLKVHDLRLDNLIAFDEEFSNAVVDADFVEQRWRFEVESDQLQGEIALPVSGTESALSLRPDVAVSGSKAETINSMPIVSSEMDEAERYIIDLEYLRLSESDLLDKDDSNLNNTVFLPSNLMAAKVDIQQLYLGDESMGNWHFLISPNDTAVLVHDINANYVGMDLRSEPDEGLLWAVNDAGDFASSVSIRASSRSLEQFILNFDSSEKPSSPLRAKDTQVEIDLNWLGGPDAIALNRLDGDIGFIISDGQFLKASGSAQGLLKLVSIINLDTVLRRMQLNFSDLLKEGLSFDKLSGTLSLDTGMVYFNDNPIIVKSSSSAFTLAGQVDLDASTIDAELIATLPVASNLPWIAALAGGLPVAAGVFIASKVFENELDRLSSGVYVIEGPLANPNARFDRIFDNKGSGKSANVKAQSGSVAGDSEFSDPEVKNNSSAN